jgi:uncharacterized membrane protein YgdD (TMEM256/DUF423 family)
MVTPIGGVGFLLAWLILASCYLMNAYQRDN